MTDVHQNNNNEPEKRFQNYIVLRKQEAKLWEEVGQYKTTGAAEARKAAVKEHNMADEIRRGEVTIVAVGMRLWNPITPKAEPQPDKLIW